MKDKHQFFKRIKEKRPLVHHITNMVTINDCANVTLAIGASPVMATGIDEVVQIGQLADALVINMRMVNDSLFESMLLAGKTANEKGIPVILDPVGVGATLNRTEKAKALIKHVKVAVVRGNASEIDALIGGEAVTRGVDAGSITISKGELANRAAKFLSSVIVISGKEDFVSDGTETIKIDNGDLWLTRISGTGCMSTSLIASFAGITDDYFHAAVTGMSVMGLAGERAKKHLQKGEGIGTFRVKLMDEIFLMNDEIWQEGVRLT